MEGASAERFILLTDIAGSSRLAEAYAEQYYAALEAHNGIVEGSVEQHGGEILKNLGDGYLVLFDDAASALNAAVDVQLALCAGQQGSIAVFPDGSKLGARSVVHGGRLTRLPGQAQDWFGPPLNRSARIGKVCHPGQLLISGVVRRALPALPVGLEELDLGRVRLRDLGEPEQLYQLTHPGFAQRQFPPLQGLDSRPNNLAVQPNAFIGRDRDLAELSRLLSGDTRLLTLHAHGGYGKSRLASQLCAHLLWRFEHGAFEVLLAPVRNHQYLPEAIADATGFQFFGKREPKQQVLDYLRNKEMLLCLDNFEHLLDGAEFIAEILKTAPKVRIIATSREPLRLTAEQVYRVKPLPLGPGSDSVQLFVDRATRVKHGFQLNDESSPLVERICERQEGIPLALELVAAWADEFTLPQLLTEVERQLEVTARMRDVPERQRSVRASLDWSYGLLELELQRALRKLSVFRGGFFIDASEAVLEQQGLQVRQILAALCDKSWLFAREVSWTTAGEAVASSRYFLRDAASHEYALQLLSAPENAEEHAEVTAAHARYFSVLMEREGPKLHAHGQLEALSTIKLELLNIYEALDTLQNRLPKDEPAALLLPIARWLQEYLNIASEFRTMLERYQTLKEAAWQAGGVREVLLQALLGCSRGQQRLSAYDAARAELGRAKELAEALGDRSGIAASLNGLGNVEYSQGNYGAARELYAEALALRREIGDRYETATSLNNLGLVEDTQGNYSAARELHAESLSIQREIGDRWGIALSLNNVGIVEYAQDNYAAARELYAESLAIERETGDRWGIAASLHNLGILECMQGNYSAARELYAEALAIQRAIGDHYGIALSLGNLGSVEYMQGNYSAARELCAESLATTREIGDRPGICDSLAAAGCLLTAVAQHRAAAVCLYGARHHAAQLGFTFEPLERGLLEQGLAIIEHPGTGLPVHEHQRLKAQAQATPLEDLARFAQGELEKLKGVFGAAEQQAGA